MAKRHIVGRPILGHASYIIPWTNLDRLQRLVMMLMMMTIYERQSQYLNDTSPVVKLSPYISPVELSTSSPARLISK